MPRPDPPPILRRATIARFRRTMRWMILFALLAALVAVVLVSRGSSELHPHMLVATALGAGLTVLLGSTLMSLAFLSASSGHDEEAGAEHGQRGDER